LGLKEEYEKVKAKRIHATKVLQAMQEQHAELVITEHVLEEKLRKTQGVKYTQTEMDRLFTFLWKELDTVMDSSAEEMREQIVYTAVAIKQLKLELKGSKYTLAYMLQKAKPTSSLKLVMGVIVPAVLGTLSGRCQKVWNEIQ